jgi:hypothetical protein
MSAALTNTSSPNGVNPNALLMKRMAHDARIEAEEQPS